MKFGVVIFPGSNCDKETVHVLRNVLDQEVVELWHKDTDLIGFTEEDWIILPGGFSYGDYLRSGAIARFSPLMQPIIDFANRGGNVWGICNGFQILCEAGLLPGALLRNINQKFICKDIHITCMTENSLLTRHIELGTSLRIPIAHAEGRYYADPETIASLEKNDQILFKYSNAQGDLTQAANINGSINHIAGICNKNRNVFGMMPHPERATENFLGNQEGLFIFNSLLGLASA